MVASPRPLFRPEAIEAQRQQWLGRVQLARPLALGWITAGVICTAVAIGAFLALAHYTRKTTVAGVLVPDRGLIRLVPASAGTVVERDVVEGQSVRAGQTLFILALARPLLADPVQSEVRRSLDERRNSLSAAVREQEALERTRLVALDRRLDALATELVRIDAEAALQQQRIALAQQALARLQQLQADHFISAAQVQTKSEELLGLQAAAQALARQKAALQRDRAEIDGERRALPLLTGSAVGGIERDLAQADRESAEQDADRHLLVQAPQAGTVASVLAEVGQSVSPASALATLVPAGSKLQARLYAPGSAVGFVQAGQLVRMRYEAFPYQKYGQQLGHVVEVSRVPLGAAELAALTLPAAGGSSEPLFRITVALDRPAESMPLAAGMRLQADVVLERRRLVAWLFEPLVGLRRRL